MYPCVILTGAGDKAFIAGADICELAHVDAYGAEESNRFGQGVPWTAFVTGGFSCGKDLVRTVVMDVPTVSSAIEPEALSTGSEIKSRKCPRGTTASISIRRLRR